MEVWSALCAALLLFAVAWRLIQARISRSNLHQDLAWVFLWAFILGLTVALIGASLYFIQDPVLCGVSFLSCSIGLMYQTGRLLPAKDKAVLITGCDSGFGHALALLLSQMGLRVFAGVLDAGGAGAQRLKEEGFENLEVLQLDVTNDQQVEAVHRYICSQVTDSGLWGLVNNAGVLLCPVDSELQALTDYRRCVEVNFLSAVRICQWFLPLLRRSRGRIVNVSSLAGEVPMSMFGAYGASKAALSLFSKVLRMEMSVWGVEVVLIQPAAFRTKIFGDLNTVSHHSADLLSTVSSEVLRDYGESYISSLPSALCNMSLLSSEDLTPVLEDMVQALLSPRPRPLYTPGQMAWLLPFLHRWCPSTVFESLIRLLPRLTDKRPAGLHQFDTAAL